MPSILQLNQSEKMMLNSTARALLGLGAAKQIADSEELDPTSARILMGLSAGASLSLPPGSVQEAMFNKAVKRIANQYSKKRSDVPQEPEVLNKKGATDTNNKIIVINNNDSNGSFIGNSAINAGMLGAGLSGGGLLASNYAKPKIQKALDYVKTYPTLSKEILEKAVTEYKGGFTGGKNPAQDLAHYISKGHQLLNQHLDEAQKVKGIDFIEKFWNHPLVSVLLNKQYDEEHYNAFKKSHLDAIQKLHEELYHEDAKTPAMGTQSTENYYELAEQKKKKLLDIMKQKNPNATEADIWNNPAKKRYLQPFYDKADNLKRTHEITQGKPVEYKNILEKKLVEFYKKNRKQLGRHVLNNAEGIQKLLDDPKVLKLFSADPANAQFVKDFQKHFKNPINQYTELMDGLKRYQTIVDEAKKYLSDKFLLVDKVNKYGKYGLGLGGAAVVGGLGINHLINSHRRNKLIETIKNSINPENN